MILALLGCGKMCVQVRSWMLTYQEGLLVSQLDCGCEGSMSLLCHFSASLSSQVEREVEGKAQVEDSDLGWSPGPAPLSSGYVTSGELSYPL